MNYLLFDEYAISTYVSENRLQSIEYPEGAKFIEHLHRQHSSEIFCNTKIEYTKDGILFVGRKKQQPVAADAGKHIFCIDLTSCALLQEETNPARLLTVVQRAFRLTLKIWNNYPFTFSERVNGTKSILFPFSITDRHRLVIERSCSVSRLENRDLSFPLLAYKYNADEPGQMADVVHTEVLRNAGEAYLEVRYLLQTQIETALSAPSNETADVPLGHIKTVAEVDRKDFVFWPYEYQLHQLTETQKRL